MKHPIPFPHCPACGRSLILLIGDLPQSPDLRPSKCDCGWTGPSVGNMAAPPCPFRRVDWAPLSGVSGGRVHPPQQPCAGRRSNGRNGEMWRLQVVGGIGPLTRRNFTS
jgi:hypothetical protein